MAVPATFDNALFPVLYTSCEKPEFGLPLALVRVMDIARPEFKLQKRRRQIILASMAIVVLVGITIGVSRLKPAAPSVEGESRHRLIRDEQSAGGAGGR